MHKIPTVAIGVEFVLKFTQKTVIDQTKYVGVSFQIAIIHKYMYMIHLQNYLGDSIS